MAICFVGNKICPVCGAKNNIYNAPKDQYCYKCGASLNKAAFQPGGFMEFMAEDSGERKEMERHG